MSDFLLIHGSCHGAWCWRELIPRLESRGHTARAIDLPAHGDDPADPGEVTLEDYAHAILDAIDRPVTLVGHSMAGYAVTAAAQRGPQKIDRLIYLCAYVPRRATTLAALRREAPRQPMREAIELSADGRTFTVPPERARDLFYNDVPEDLATWAVGQLCPEPIWPQETEIASTDRAESLPRAYIRCTDDQTVPYEYQVTMTEHWPASRVADMETGHSPFLSAPEDLAWHLETMAQR